MTRRLISVRDLKIGDYFALPNGPREVVAMKYDLDETDKPAYCRLTDGVKLNGYFDTGVVKEVYAISREEAVSLTLNLRKALQI